MRSVSEHGSRLVLQRFPKSFTATRPALFDMAATDERCYGKTLLSQAIQATFERRRTPLPLDSPTALTDSFARDQTKQTQWNAFVRKGRIVEKVPFGEVVELLRMFLMPPTLAAARDEGFKFDWPAGGPWK